MVDARADRVLDLDERAQHQVGVPNLPVDGGPLQVCIEPLAGGDQPSEVVGAIVQHARGGGEISRGLAERLERRIHRCAAPIGGASQLDENRFEVRPDIRLQGVEDLVEVGGDGGPRQRDRCPIAERPGLAAVEVDVLGTEQAVWTDGGGGIGMKLWGVTRVDRHPDQGITVLVFDAVHSPDARPAQFDPGARVQLTIRARLQLEVQPLIPGQREGDEHDDREREGGDRHQQADEPRTT